MLWEICQANFFLNLTPNRKPITPDWLLLKPVKPHKLPSSNPTISSSSQRSTHISYPKRLWSIKVAICVHYSPDKYKSVKRSRKYLSVNYWVTACCPWWDFRVAMSIQASLIKKSLPIQDRYVLFSVDGERSPPIHSAVRRTSHRWVHALWTTLHAAPAHL